MTVHPWLEWLEGSTSVASPIHDAPAAAAEIGEVLDLTARTLPACDAVLLSGGIDSMLAAVAATHAGLRPVCVTVVTDPDDPALDGFWARQCAEHLGLEWHPAIVSSHRLRDLARLAVRHIGGRGLYQVGRAITDIAAVDVLQELDVDVAWTGTGADLLFGTYPDPGDPDGPARLDWSGRAAMLRRARSAADTNPYAQRQDILAYAGIDTRAVFETVAALEVASRCRPTALVAGQVLHGDGASTTKWPLRLLALEWGLPAELAAQPKRALQDSSGVFGALAECARLDELALCDDFTSQEPKRHGRDAAIMTAYWLQLLGR
jgi:asparagine synthetase B (glutamine-hydrolysing)